MIKKNRLASREIEGGFPGLGEGGGVLGEGGWCPRGTGVGAGGALQSSILSA